MTTLTFAQGISLPNKVYKILKRLSRKRRSPQWLVERARIILLAGRGHGPSEIARQLGIDRKTARRWCQRWQRGMEGLTNGLEGASSKSLEMRIRSLLEDSPRSGTPAQFSPEQLAHIIAVACEDPQECGRPISHWSAAEIADEVVKRAIVAQISERTVNRWLAEMDLKPHRIRYWLNSTPACPEIFQQEVMQICQLHEQAPTLLAQGIHIVSTDEKTGIQALERLSPTQLARPGSLERREFEYQRHGTCCLIASLEVALAQVIAPTIGLTPTESDFAQHIEAVIATDPQAGWTFILDQLNTHKSETLVRLVARHCNLTLELGEKGKSGILASMESRATFLTDPSHRIRFVYTPKHTSWLNQIEMWFSILVRKLLKRGSFTSVDDLSAQMRAFIDYFNRTLAKPFQWKFKPCRWTYNTPLEKAA
jgi:transposase